jgi:hypothetical protein
MSFTIIYAVLTFQLFEKSKINNNSHDSSKKIQ